MVREKKEKKVTESPLVLMIEECPREQGRKAALWIRSNYSVHPFQNDTMKTS